MTDEDVKPILLDADFRLGERRKRQRLILLLLGLLWFVASIPMFMTYLPVSADGHDLVFHLYRIQGIADGLQHGQFPVRMQYTQVNGFGFPVSIMYGDIFLYVPALLCIMGISVNHAYQFFVLIVNLATVVTSFVLARRVFKSDYVAFIGALLWTLAPYRLEDLYLRGAVGEYMALLFFPILLYGWYAIVVGDSNRCPWLWAAIGATGIVLSHVLSVILVGVGIVFFLFAGIWVNHTLRMWKQVGLSFVVSIALCLWFLVPFFDYYRSVDMVVKVPDAGAKIALTKSMVVQPSQWFMLFVPFYGNSVNDPRQIAQDMPFAIGWAILCGVLLYCVARILIEKRDRTFKQQRVMSVGLLSLISAVVALWLSSSLFPWRTSTRFNIWNKVIGLLATIQFSWRFIGVASLLLVITACCAIACLQAHSATVHIARTVSAAMIAVALCEAGFAMTSMLQHSEEASPYAGKQLIQSNYGVMGGEYLPAGYDGYREAQQPKTKNVAMSQYVKDDGRVDFQAKTTGPNPRVTVPLFMYPNYRAYTESGEELSLTSSAQKWMVVHLPEGYSGAIHIEYTEPVSWRIAELFSLCTVAVLVIVLVVRQRKNAVHA